MFDDTMIVAILVAIAFFAGIQDSIAGGGGLLLIPGAMLAGVPPHLALGQEKLVSICGTLVSAVRFSTSGRVSFAANARSVRDKILPYASGGTTSILGAWLGARAILWVEPSLAGRVIAILLPFALLMGVFARRAEPEGSAVATPRTVVWKLTFIGFALGFYDGFLGPGTGTLMILALRMILKVDLVSASGTSKLLNLGTNLGALVPFLMAGTVLPMAVSAYMILANMLGAHFGASLALHRTLGPRIVRSAMVVSCLVIGVTLLRI